MIQDCVPSFNGYTEMDIANNPHAYRSHCPMQIVRNVPCRLFAMSYADCLQSPMQDVHDGTRIAI